MTTFCWFPPDNAVTVASSDGAFTDSEPSEVRTLIDFDAAAEERVRDGSAAVRRPRRSRARTGCPCSPSESRSAGM